VRDRVSAYSELGLLLATHVHTTGDAVLACVPGRLKQCSCESSCLWRINPAPHHPKHALRHSLPSSPGVRPSDVRKHLARLCGVPVRRRAAHVRVCHHTSAAAGTTRASLRQKQMVEGLIQGHMMGWHRTPALRSLQYPALHAGCQAGPFPNSGCSRAIA
jgi:hypothetical protein